MFDIGWGELLVIGIAALIFIGPKELPGVLRTLGQWMARIRRMAGEFQNQFQEAMREVELADLRKEVDEMAAQAASYSKFDPLASVRKDLEEAQRDIESTVADVPPAGTQPAAEPPVPTSPPVETNAEATPASLLGTPGPSLPLDRTDSETSNRVPGGSEPA
jgi:sec-independent protein translocase protein TatB